MLVDAVGLKIRALRDSTSNVLKLILIKFSLRVMNEASCRATRMGQRRQQDRGDCMSDTAYLSARAQEELRAASNSTDRRTREIHLQLADAYAFRMREELAIARRSDLQPVAPD